MTLTSERPAMPGQLEPSLQTANSGGRRSASIRFSAKLARRELRRRPWRSMLVVALVALPTWMMLNVAASVRTGVSDEVAVRDFSSDVYLAFTDPGSDGGVEDSAADLSIDGGGSMSSAEIEELLPADAVVQRAVTVRTSIMDNTGTQRNVQFTTLDISTDAARTWQPIVEGRAPVDGEVAISRSLADDLGVDVGDSLTLQEPAGSWRVSALTGGYYDNFIAAPGFDEARFSTLPGFLLIDFPSASSFEDLPDLEFNVPAGSRFIGDSYPSSEQAEAVGITWLAATFVFMMFGVVIIAAFATIARGQLVLVGQLLANGATRRVARRSFALQGFWAGFGGVIAGTVIALATLRPTKPIIEGMIGQPISGVVWNPIDVVAIGAIGVAIAVLAAMVPARGLTNVSVLEALAGRRPDRAVPKWMVPVGLGSFGLGLLILILATSDSVNVVAAMIGSFGVVLGVCLIGPFVVQLASKAAPVMPLSIRLSLRGLGRARLRSAAVVSSVAVTTGVMAALVAGVQTDVGGPAAGEVADNVVIVASLPALNVTDSKGDPLLNADGSVRDGMPDDLGSVNLEWTPTEADANRALVTATLPDADEVPFSVAVSPDGSYENDGELFGRAEEGAMESSGRIIETAQNLPLLADEAVLDAFSLPREFSTALATAGYAYAVNDPERCAGQSLEDGSIPTSAAAPVEPVPASSLESQTPAFLIVDGIWCYGAVGPFISPEFAEQNGYQIEPAGSLFVNPRPLTAAQRDAVDPTADSNNPSAFVEWEFAGDNYAPIDTSGVEFLTQSFGAISSDVMLYYPTVTDDEYVKWQLGFLIAAVVFVGLVAGIGLALAASDSRRDRAVLRVVGAKPSTQRRIAATDAWVMVIIGTLLGVPTALFTAHLVTVASKQDTPTGVPWLFVGAEFVVVPLVIAGFAYLSGLLRRSKRPMAVLQVD